MDAPLFIDTEVSGVILAPGYLKLIPGELNVINIVPIPMAKESSNID